MAQVAIDGITDVTVATGKAAEMAGKGADAAANACSGEGDSASYQRRAVRTISGGAQKAGTVAAEVKSAVCGVADRAVAQPADRVLSSVEQVAREHKDTREAIKRTLTPPQEVKDVGAAILELLKPKTGADLFGHLPELPGRQADGSTRPTVPEPGTATPERATSGSNSPELFTVEIPSAAQDVTGSAADVRHSTGSSADDTRSSGDDREGAPDHPVRIPLVPATAPTAPGGSHGVGHVDGTMLGVPAGSFAVVDDTVIGEIRSGVRHLQVSPGAQPGVTPD